jgi:hypothetical protein
VNNPKTRNIEPDPVKARILKKGFDEFAAGKHSLETLRHRLHFLGLVSKAGKPLVKSVMHGILTNVSIRPRTYFQPRDLGVSLMAKKENDTINI